MGLRQDFEVALQKLRTELIADLNRTDVLKKDKLEALQLECNQKIVNVQVQFLQKLPNESSKTRVEFSKPDAKTFSDFGKITLYAGAGSAATGTALTFITLGVPQVVTVPYLVLWTSSTTVMANVSLATYLATFLGISATMATAIVTGGVGLLVALAGYFTFFPVWRRRIRKKMLEDFDVSILPLLRDWADDVVNQANKFNN